MTVQQMKDSLSLQALTLPDGEREIQGVYIGDLLSWVMGRAQADNVWLTIMSNLTSWPWQPWPTCPASSSVRA